MGKARSSTLPDSVSLDDLRFLLGGVSKQRVHQLEAEGILARTARGRYSIGSIPAFIKHQRSVGSGPKAWMAARTALAEEKLRGAQIERQVREGELLLRDVALDIISRAFRDVRDKVLALPARAAPRVHGLPTVAHRFQILDAAAREICESAADQRAADLMAAIDRVAGAATKGGGSDELRRHDRACDGAAGRVDQRPDPTA
jgi:hypothetical protein